MNTANIVNIDYCGYCNGKCLTCLLSEEERSLSYPFLVKEKLSSSLKKAVLSLDDRSRDTVIGFGRGNILSLEEKYFFEMADSVFELLEELGPNVKIIEVSTSLIGKIDDQIKKAKKLCDIFPEKTDVKFVVVIDTQNINKENYWSNIEKFFKEMSDFRGGGDDSEDVLSINISSRSLPSVETLIDKIKWVKSSVNIIWIGETDFIGCESKEETAEILEVWFRDFYLQAKENGKDSSLAYRVENALQYGNKITGIQEAKTMIQNHYKRFRFIASDGSVHHALPSIFGDIDPVRYKDFYTKTESFDANDFVLKDTLEFMRIKACRECEFAFSCISSGMYKIAVMNKKLSAHGKICPSLIKKTFEEAIKNV